LGEFNRAFELYQAARCYAEESQYAQVKAKSLIGLAELNRKIGNFSKAFSIHFEAMELLTHIRAISDLAESYFQLALTHQAAGDIEGKNKNFHEAIRLFSEMEAPRQVERVRQSVQN
jgi:tetratricopeptide (TPR) repeat protein